MVSGDRFYGLSIPSLFVFALGVISITIGGLLGRALILHQSTNTEVDDRVAPSRHSYVRHLLDVGLLFCLVGLPFYWQKAAAAAAASGRTGFFAGVRQQTVLAEDTVSSISLLDNLVILATLLAPIAFFESDSSRSRRLRVIVATVLGLTYGALTASKGAPVHLILVVLVVCWLKDGRPSISALTTIAIACLAFFVAGLILVNFIDLDFYDPWEMTWSALEITPNYMIGSLVGFDRFLSGERFIENTQGVFRGFLGIARKLGAEVELPSIHAQYTMISNYENTNTYTIYFSYISDLGLLGTATWMIVLGATLTFIYRNAQSRNPIAILFYAMLADAIIFSVHAEHFLLGVNQYGKSLLLLFFLYRVPRFKLR